MGISGLVGGVLSKGQMSLLYRNLYLAALTLYLAGPTLPSFAQSDPNWNVNARYTVERCQLPDREGISSVSRREVDRLVGKPFNEMQVRLIAWRLRDELKVAEVGYHLMRGTTHGTLELVWDLPAPRRWPAGSVTRIAGSELGSTFLSATRNGRDQVSVGLSRSRIDSPEQAIRASATWTHASDHAGDQTLIVTGFQAMPLWREATIAQAAPGELYGLRGGVGVLLQTRLTRDWLITGGIELQSLSSTAPGHTQTSLRLVTLQTSYVHYWASSSASLNRFSSDYSLRVSSAGWASRESYVRNLITAEYTRTRKQGGSFRVRGLAGNVQGNAPLFERFALGGPDRLRGWNHDDISPTGANAVLMGSAEYGTHSWVAFYEAGWAKPSLTPGLKQSAGFGIRARGTMIALAFPLRAQAIYPILVADVHF